MEKHTIKSESTANMAHDLDEIFKMYQLKTRDEIEELKNELFSNVAAHPENKDEFVKSFKANVATVIATNEQQQRDAANRVVQEIKTNIKARVKNGLLQHAAKNRNFGQTLKFWSKI